jgi:hypothetical protein
MTDRLGKGFTFWLMGFGLGALAVAGGLLLDFADVTSLVVRTCYLAVVITAFGIWASRRRR